MTSVVLLFGSLSWDVFSGALIILLMSWIHYVFSVASPGLYWLSLYLVFLVLKFATSQFALQGIIQIFGLLFGATLLQELLQLWFMAMNHKAMGTSWSIAGPIFGSAFFQAILGLMFTRLLLARSQMVR
jgi:hypothetical protein